MPTEALDELRSLAAAAGSSGVAVAVNGEVEVLAGDDQPVPVQSVTKFVVALGVGAGLAAMGDPIELADRPLGRDAFDEWSGDDRSLVTIESLLAHRSGLRPIPPHELEASTDPAQLAIDSRIDPAIVGELVYNNAGTLLVAEAVYRLTGDPIDIWIQRSIFDPLAIAPTWQRAASGAVLAHGGLIASARDLATIGDAVLRSGHGGGPLPSQWIKWMLAGARSAYPQHAWVRQTVTHRLVESWRAAGVDSTLIREIGPIGPGGVPLEHLIANLSDATLSSLGAAVSEHGQRICEVELGPKIGWGHDGDGGQWLIVAPTIAAAISHTRARDNYGLAPGFFPPKAVLDCL